MSASQRLGADPLERPAARESAAATGAGRALRHILDAPPGPAVPPCPPAPEPPAPAVDRELLRREVSAAFSRALERLSALAAGAGAWAWGGEGDSLAFLRLMACYVAEQGVEGVDLSAFLRESPDLWPGRGLAVAPGLERLVVPLERGFRLALALQAALDGLPGPGRRGEGRAAPLFARLDATPSGKARVRLAGAAWRFAAHGEGYLDGPGRALAELAREEGVCASFTRGASWAELSILA